MDTPSYDSKGQLEFAAKQILNSLSSRRVIGQAEAHHSELNLPLTLCSENMIEIHISGWTRIKENILKNMDIFYKYALREDRHEMSLWQYFHFKHNNNNKKWKVEYSFCCWITINSCLSCNTFILQGITYQT